MHLHSHSLGHLVDWGRGTSRGEFAGIGVGSARAIQVGEKLDFTSPKMLVLPLVWSEILAVGRLWGHSPGDTVSPSPYGCQWGGRGCPITPRHLCLTRDGKAEQKPS